MTEQLELPFDPFTLTLTTAEREIAIDAIEAAPNIPEHVPLDKLLRRAEILRTAEEYVTKNRAVEHGDMKDNFNTIAVYWSEHLCTEVTPIDVAAMMALLKVARIKSSPGNLDNWVDACGYLACGGELADVDE